VQLLQFLSERGLRHLLGKDTLDGDTCVDGQALVRDLKVKEVEALSLEACPLVFNYLDVLGCRETVSQAQRLAFYKNIRDMRWKAIRAIPSEWVRQDGQLLFDALDPREGRKESSLFGYLNPDTFVTVM
jgi:hypothetical protein